MFSAPQDLYLYRQHGDVGFTLVVTVLEAAGLPPLPGSHTDHSGGSHDRVSPSPCVTLGLHLNGQLVAEQQTRPVPQQQLQDAQHMTPSSMTVKYNESFKFAVPAEALLEKFPGELRFSVHARDYRASPLGAVSLPIGSDKLGTVHESWLKLEQQQSALGAMPAHTAQGELLVRCELTQKPPVLEELLHVFDTTQSVQLELGPGERDLTLLVATWGAGVEGTYSFSARTLDGSHCRITPLCTVGQGVLAPSPKDALKMKRLSHFEPAVEQVCAVCGEPVLRTEAIESELGPCHSEHCWASAAGIGPDGHMRATPRPTLPRSGGVQHSGGAAVLSEREPPPYMKAVYTGLAVTVVEAAGLPAVSGFQRGDPYFKLLLLNGGCRFNEEPTNQRTMANTRRTRARRAKERGKTGNARWSEQFHFDFARDLNQPDNHSSSIGEAELVLQLFIENAVLDLFGADAPVGEASVKLAEIAADRGGVYERWLPLQKPLSNQHRALSGGEVLVRCKLLRQLESVVVAHEPPVRPPPLPERDSTSLAPPRHARHRVQQLSAGSTRSGAGVGGAGDTARPGGLRLKGGLAAEEQLEQAKRRIQEAIRLEMHRHGDGVDLSGLAIEDELREMQVSSPLHATPAQKQVMSPSDFLN